MEETSEIIISNIGEVFQCVVSVFKDDLLLFFSKPLDLVLINIKTEILTKIFHIIPYHLSVAKICGKLQKRV